MKRQDLDILQANAKPLPANASRAELLNAVATLIDTIGPATFKSLRNVEGKGLAVLRATAVAGSPLEPIAEALKAGDRDPGNTVGGVMDVLNLTQTDVNALACYCDNGDEMTADRAAKNLRTLADKR